MSLELVNAVESIVNVDGSGPIDVAVNITGSGKNLTKGGAGVLVLDGANSYSGATKISAGTLKIGSGSIATSSSVEVAGGAAFDVTGPAGGYSMGTTQALKVSGSSTAAVIATISGKNLTTGANTTIQFSSYNGTAPLNVSGTGSVVLASTNSVAVTNNGTTLNAGDYDLVVSGSGNTVAVTGTAPGSVTVDGSGGLCSSCVATVQISAGKLRLHVAASGNSAPAVTSSPASLVLTGGATLNGTVTSDGGVALIDRGFYWATATGVTTSSTQLSESGTTVTAFSKALSGLNPNTQYFYKAYASNSIDTTLSATEQNFYTLANTPTVPTVGGATQTSLTVAVGSGDGNPAATTYAVQETTGGKYVQADGTLNTTAVYQTAAAWGTKTVTGLAGLTTYTFQVKARNGASVDTGFGPAASGTTLVAPTLVAGWDFQTTTNGGTAAAANPSTPTAFAANFGTGNLYLNGTNGSSSWSQSTELNSFSGTTLNTAGTNFSTTTSGAATLSPLNGSSNSANGKSMVFKVSMTDRKDLGISYAAQKTNTGFDTHLWQYSTDGINWTTAQTVTGISTTFAVISLNTIAALNNVSTAYVRLTLSGATSTSQNNRLDNIQFVATPAYFVNYDANGGSGSQVDSTAYDQGSIATVLGAGTITRAGYTFIGWNTAADGSGTNYSPGDTITNITQSVNLYAKWTINTYTLTYNHGTGGSITGQATQTVPYGGSGSQVTAVADAGNHYHFVNWSPDGNANPSRTDTNVTADATYTANFALDQFSVLYNANGGTGTTPATGPADYGSTVNLAANGFTRTGYTFTGWNTQSGGGGIHYAEGAAFVIPGSNTTLYAEWSLASVATTTTVAVSPSPTTYGQSATITATVKTAALVPVTLGTVAIYDNAGCSGTVLTSGTPNSSGQITVSTAALGGGIHTITACYTGTAPFTDSTGNTQHTVNKADQTITFGTIQDQTYTSGGYVTFTLPSASSGLQIELASTTPAVCTVPFPHVGQANFVSPGTCTIRASQGGDGNYNAAADVDSTFQILAPTRTLAGIVSYGNAATGTVYIPDATVSASGTPAVTSTTTDASGNYLLSGFGTGSYTISVSKPTQNCLTHDGVMINDASLIAQHTIHMISLTGSALAAANVSDSPQVTAYDASLIAQYVICMSNPDSHAGEWRFSSYTNTIAPTDTHDFSGILKGDVDGDWSATPPPVQSLAANALGMDVTRVSVPELAAQQGSQVTVPLRIDNLNGKGVVAYQFDIAYDPSVLGTTPNGRGAATLDGTLSNGLTVLTNSPEPGLLKVAVYGAIPATGGDGVYLKLGFTAQGNAGTTSPLAINAFMLNDARTQVLAQNGSVTVQAASGPAFNGRVLSASGAPIANARIAVRSASGQLVTMLSNSFGYVYIGGLEPGQSYTMTTTAKGFTFRPVTLSATSGLTQMDIVANP